MVFMRFILYYTFIFLFLTTASYAASEKKPTALDASEIKRVENYLNNISTLTAEFLQVAPSGETSTGTFFLSRPGKLRWQYNPPTPILIVANGSLITYYDSELKEASYVSVNDSLAGFLTRKVIRFDGDVAISNSSKNAGLLRISVIQKGKKEEGQLTLICSEDPAILKKLEVVDASGQLTTITLTNLQYGTKLNKKLFELENLPSFKRRD